MIYKRKQPCAVCGKDVIYYAGAGTISCACGDRHSRPSLTEFTEQFIPVSIPLGGGGELIIPVRLESYSGSGTELVIGLAGCDESCSHEMWIAVHVKDGKVDQGLTDYGYRSIEELREAYKNKIIMEVKE